MTRLPDNENGICDLRALQVALEGIGRRLDNDYTSSEFMNWCFDQVGIKKAGLQLSSWLKWGIATKKPGVGCVAIIAIGNKFYTGFYMGYSEDLNINVLGVNRSGRVSIEKYPESSVISYRKALL